jgi:hypothetical protein
MWWWLLLVLCALGMYYLFCAFIPAIRIGQGRWAYHVPLTIILSARMGRKNFKVMDESKVSSVAYLWTGAGYLATGIAGTMNHFEILSEGWASTVFLTSFLAAIAEVVLDWFDTPAQKGTSDPPVV